MKNFDHYVVVAKVEDMRIERAFRGPYSNAIKQAREYLSNLDVLCVKYDSNKHSAELHAHYDDEIDYTFIETL
jgi:hypothetical protein